MDAVTVTELLDITRNVVGEDGDCPIDESILDTPFESLNFDSLHIIAVSAQIEQRHGFKFPEGRRYAQVTPRELVSIANELIENQHAKE